MLFDQLKSQGTTSASDPEGLSPPLPWPCESPHPVTPSPDFPLGQEALSGLHSGPCSRLFCLHLRAVCRFGMRIWAEVRLQTGKPSECVSEKHFNEKKAKEKNECKRDLKA